jgi:hypothetical protein
MSDSPSRPGPDQLSQMLRLEHLRRLARFALIDDVPASWGVFPPDGDKGSPEPGHA